MIGLVGGVLLWSYGILTNLGPPEAVIRAYNDGLGN